MFQVIFSSTLAFAFGLYFLVAQLLHLPTLATTRAALNLARRSHKKTKFLDAIVLELSSRFAKWIHMEESHRRRLAATLKAADIAYSPEIWLSRCYVRFGLLLLLMIPMLFILPILSPIIIILAIRQLYTDLHSADVIVRSRRDKIERDLPRFTATVAQELMNTRNVLAIFKGYLFSARPAFRAEMETTIADMMSGNQETALNRLDARVGSPMLSQVVRGLQAVLRGDDSSNYFEILSHDFDALEVQRLNLEAAKVPGKINTCIGILFICFAVVIFYILGTQIGQSYASFNM